MSKKILIDVEKTLKEGDVLIYKDGKMVPAYLRNLLPELKKHEQSICELNERLDLFKQDLFNLKNEINARFKELYVALNEVIKDGDWVHSYNCKVFC